MTARKAETMLRRIRGGARQFSPKTFDLEKHAAKLNVRLSPAEIDVMKGARRRRKHFRKADFDTMVRKDMVRWAERQTLVKYIAEADENTAGQKLLLGLDYLGTALFAVIGTQMAGQAGMNIVGATFVGCVAATGGGTLNNLITGNLRGGVFWVRNPIFLAIAVVSSVVTFYGWPIYEHERAKAEFDALRRAACQEEECPDETCVTLEQFERALQRDPKLGQRLIEAVKPHLEPEIKAAMDAAPSLGPALIFEWIDRDHERVLRQDELKLVARLAVMSSAELFFLETAALGAVAVIGAQAGVARGVGPLASIATGVTICFGGVLRDVLCNRDIALAAQSYAFATAAGSVVYVGLRQLVVYNIAQIPLILRIAAGYLTTVAQRAWVFFIIENDESKALPPMALYKAPPIFRHPSTDVAHAEALCEAAAQNDVYQLKLLTARGFNAATADYDRRTPLHLAASEGAFDAVKFLVEANADLSPLDRWHRTPLDDARESQHTLILAYLQGKGAKFGPEIHSSSER